MLQGARGALGCAASCVSTTHFFLRESKLRSCFPQGVGCFQCRALATSGGTKPWSCCASVLAPAFWSLELLLGRWSHLFQNWSTSRYRVLCALLLSGSPLRTSVQAQAAQPQDARRARHLLHPILRPDPAPLACSPLNEFFSFSASGHRSRKPSFGFWKSRERWSSACSEFRKTDV